MRWFLADVLGLFSINVGPFSRNVVPSDRIFSINLVPKQRMFSVPVIYVLGPLQVTELSIVVNSTVVAGIEITVELNNSSDVPFSQFLALGTQSFAHLLEKLRAIDKLDFSLALRLLVVGEYPDIGGDAGVVEHIGR